jgi:hypothetical protein
MHPDEKTAEIFPAETVEESHVQKDAHVSPSAPAVDLAALTDRALHFLATASNETLGACLVGLGAGTYLMLGRVGLLLIGVVGGVVLHAQWEGHARGGSDSTAQNSEARKRELGVDVAHRVLDWRGAASSKDKDESDSSSIDVQLYAGKQLDYSSFKPETAVALTELTDAVIRDYVKYVQSWCCKNMSDRAQVVVFTHIAGRRLIPSLLSPDLDRFPDFRLLPPFSQAARR